MKTTNELKQFFADALGEDAVMQSPESPRPYVKVGMKGEAVLYANFDLGTACGHKPGPDGKLMHIPAVGVVARFFQTGGNPETFQPQFQVRAFGKIEGKEVVRLQKNTFPLCAMFGANIEESWQKQDVTAQLVDWLKGLITAAGGTPIGDGVLREVVKQALQSVPESGEGDFFSLEAMDHKDVADQIKSEKAEKIAKMLGAKIKKEDGDKGPLLN